MMETLRLAADGDSKALAGIRRLLRRNDEAGSTLAMTYCDMYSLARKALVNFAVGDSELTRELMSRRIDDLRDELAGPNATPLERILCERVALCWFDTHEMDRRYIDTSGKRFNDARYYQDRRDRANRRFLAACRTLASVRKLALPAIQVNVARQQVNVAGST
jgi:hypothetical protein